MFKMFFLILFLGHIIGDFYLQNTAMARGKLNKPKCFILHTVLYSLAIFLVCIPIWNCEYILPIVMLSISHAAIDGMKAVINRGKLLSTCVNRDMIFFLIDQFLHVVCIVIVSIYMTKEAFLITTNRTVSWLIHLNVDYIFVIKLLILLLGNIRPCNILIKSTVQFYKPKDEKKDDNQTSGNDGAGATIGVLERYLITFFAVNGEYSLIGLILTAKSIARFSKLSEDKEFAEYYLMGTLLSVLLVIGLCKITL